MPPKNETFSIYPDAGAVETLMTVYGEKRAGACNQAIWDMATIFEGDDIAICGGPSSAAAMRAIACWAIVERNASAAVCEILERAEWNFLADVLNGTVDGDFALGMHQHGASALAIEVHDAQQLNGTGDRWLGDELERGSGQAATQALIAKIQAMPWEQIVAIRTAVIFFWSDAGVGRIDTQEDEWWTIRYRLRYQRDTAAAGQQ